MDAMVIIGVTLKKGDRTTLRKSLVPRGLTGHLGRRASRSSLGAGDQAYT